ncbi:N-acetylmuramyl-L-alanine amidase, negative regulator of AmpC, AmpD [Leptotrichia wadei]|jgi:N-acetylmuramoyl-L-alanine amidase domain protein|uniref:N-acetylmuramoyl-L-alanine amidase n=1 Tax=Leptotrichia wadei TaxID=157687 RepID=A0A7U6LAN4_9FUSO|nr:N-acetylmuramoyl-L-alanine amidase [Leptotrichia wadei]BBM42785.1 N-acetylmuramyl-L-alanine amidase, negative regulator of AmpC, AmpD [Leptotrichia wadei]
MKKNVANILFLISILSVGNILNANNQDVSKDVKKPIEIRIDDNGQVRKDQSGPNKNKKNDNSGQNSYVNTNTQRGGTETISNSAGTVKVDASSYNSQGQDYRQKFIILHYTAGNRDSSLKTLTENEVSAHYLVSDDKSEPVYSLVDENKRAWHAGVSDWKGRNNLNDTSIGIEIVNGGDVSGTFVPYKDFQIKEVAVLVKYLADKYEIPATNILGHSDIAPQRKSDPGPLFPWRELYTQYNIGMWYDNETKNNYEREYETKLSMTPVSDVQRELNKFGYGISITGSWDKQTKNVIKAFQHHFRPSNYSGEMDVETFAILKALNEKYNKK